jgi:hypothetical protein
LKPGNRWNWDELRHRFVLTPEEKRVIAFVVATLLLGLATKCYREAQPQPPSLIHEKHPTGTKNQR